MVRSALSRRVNCTNGSIFIQVATLEVVSLVMVEVATLEMVILVMV